MAEGFYPPDQRPVPGVDADRLSAALVRILPKTLLVLDVVSSQDEANAKARNESRPDGVELWLRYFTTADLARVDDAEFSMGMVRHEFCRLVKSGASWPASIWLDGGGSGFAVAPNGLVLTNYHLVTSEVGAHKRQCGVLDQEVRCQSLRAQVAQQDAGGTWRWVEAQEVRLVSKPPESRAIVVDAQGHASLREDTALLRVVPAPSAWLELSPRAPRSAEPVWMAGFPLRSARAAASLTARGYTDADGSLRVSTGTITHVDADGYFGADVDGSMGNSGSPVLDAQGKVIGLFSRALGNGPRNAFEYGHLQRVCVSMALALAGLNLAPRRQA